MRCVCCVLPHRVFSCLVWSSCLVHKGSGSHFHFCPRPCSSTHRWARRSQPTNTGDHAVKSVLPYPHQPDDHRMCVIAKRLGCLHRLTHAARLGYFFGASMTRRTLPLGLFTAATSIRKFRDNFRTRRLSFACFNACFPPRRASDFCSAETDEPVER